MSEYFPEMQGVAVADASPATRLAFIRKVYLMVFTGLLAFAAVGMGLVFAASSGSALALDIVVFPLRHPFIALALIIGGQLGAQALQRVPVVNIGVFYLFASFYGWLTSGLMMFAIAKAGGSMVIIYQALSLTTLVFGSLTAFVMLSRKDFNFMGGFLWVGAMTFLGVVLLSYLGSAMFGWDASGLSMGLSIASCLLIVGYILYDTSNVLHHYTEGMVVAAALALFIDFVILFRNILYMLSRRR